MKKRRSFSASEIHDLTSMALTPKGQRWAVATLWAAQHNRHPRTVIDKMIMLRWKFRRRHAQSSVSALSFWS